MGDQQICLETAVKVKPSRETRVSGGKGPSAKRLTPQLAIRARCRDCVETTADIRDCDFGRVLIWTEADVLRLRSELIRRGRGPTGMGHWR